ncbi:blastula protease 10 isoform X2 [Nematostella vectensis]|uniref:blastula protease 10 isoform X2 n=1 Tax=Nematostella vectensis TaxID=45351 RepID=UPI0020775B07|nr:blastula protease 10 isoform X2 [Nematostella vectensis]
MAQVLILSVVLLLLNISPAQSLCVTRRTTSFGCCVFPFKFQGEDRYECDTYGNHTSPWCATSSDYDKNPQAWGECAGSQPREVFDTIMYANRRRFSDGVELFQGDIVLTPELKSDVYTYMQSRGVATPWDKNPPPRRGGGRSKRAVMRSNSMRWMSSDGRSGEVPYEITYSSYSDRAVILRAMRHWQEKVPCLKFVSRRSAPGKKYLSFFAGGGCYSMVGRQRGSGRQQISIGSGCGTLGVVAHEIGHALGFWHEQSRPDRDRYVRINWSNIQSGMAFNFQKYDTGKINSRQVSYDYSSLMHYGPTAFANRRGLRTIERTDGKASLGQRYGLSAKDVLQANRLYCGSTPPQPTPPPPRPPTPPPPGECKDEFRVCGSWARLGHCNSPRFGTYVKVYCKESCRACY